MYFIIVYNYSLKLMYFDSVSLSHLSYDTSFNGPDEVLKCLKDRIEHYTLNITMLVESQI